MNDHSETGFLGAIIAHRAFQHELASTSFEHPDWHWAGRSSDMFLYARGISCQLFQWGSLAVLIRGYVKLAGTSGTTELQVIADTVKSQYLDEGVFDLRGFDGSFTVILADGELEAFIVQRNLVGNSLTYYSHSTNVSVIASNLATMMDTELLPRKVNQEILPAVFLHRCAPGRDTLFEGCYRLLPGEQLQLDHRQITCKQRQSIGDLTHGESTPKGDVTDKLSALLTDILKEHVSEHSRTANLLSGGVDSSLLQAYWNKVAPIEHLPKSFSVSVDHPTSYEDTEYSLTAAQILQTDHESVEVRQPYVSYLTETVAATGELPNHAQVAYFRYLASAMADRGYLHGLCGEAADSLFGMDQTTKHQMAMLIRRFCPTQALRSCGKKLATLLQRHTLAKCFALAEYVFDENNIHHPVNQVAIYSDHSLMERCFGLESMRHVFSRRRSLLDQFNVSTDPLARLHAMGFLGSAIHTASFKTVLFNSVGSDLHCPFLDTRLIRFVLTLRQSDRFPFRRPKELLKRCLAMTAGQEIAYRRKLGFGQPIYEWMRSNGQLRPAINTIDHYSFLPEQVMNDAKANPNWFLFTLLCFDLWHKLFIQQSLPRTKRHWWQSPFPCEQVHSV